MDKTRRQDSQGTGALGGRRPAVDDCHAPTASGQRDPTTPFTSPSTVVQSSIHCRCLAPTKHTAHSQERNKQNVFTIPMYLWFLKPTTENGRG